MKKLFLIGIAMGLMLVSCKKEEPGINESTENTVSEINGSETTDNPNHKPVSEISVPEFSDPSVQQYANELVKYYHEIQAAEAEGNKEKLEELIKQQVDYHQKQQEILKPLSAEEKERFREWSAEVAKAALQ